MSRNFIPKGKKQTVCGINVKSSLEASAVIMLTMANVEFKYEKKKIKYMPPPAKMKTYTPDFSLPNGILVEMKGVFTGKDRKKHLLIKKQHPDLDIRFVFSNPHEYLTGEKLKTYAEWCDLNGFIWADKTIPSDWLK